jgi:hypothetical protein
MKKCLSYTILFALCCFNTFGQCPSVDEVKSVSIGFSYDNDHRLTKLSAPKNDVLIFQKMAQNFSPSPIIFDDDDVGFSKTSFLMKLHNETKNAKVVNLNIAGHGVKVMGQYHLMLPMPGNKCTYGKDLGAFASWTPEEQTCFKKFAVSASEIQMAIGQKPIFGINDSCFAAGFKLSRGSILQSSKSDQEAIEERSHSRFINHLKSTVLDQKHCPQDIDADADGNISFFDLLEHYHDKEITFVDNEKVHEADSRRGRQSAWTQGRKKELTKCFRVATLSAKCGGPVEKAVSPKSARQ